MRNALAIACVAAGLAGAAAAAQATMLVRPMALEEVTAEATRIVQATVTDVRSGRDESGVPATWITIDVARSLKGSAAGTLTFKQVGAAEPLPDGAVSRIAGLPRYTPGEEVVLFLRADSGRGFTSPAGLGQGVYRITRTGGRRVIRSDLPGGPEDLDAFLSKVARLAASSGIGGAP